MNKLSKMPLKFKNIYGSYIVHLLTSVEIFIIDRKQHCEEFLLFASVVENK